MNSMKGERYDMRWGHYNVKENDTRAAANAEPKNGRYNRFHSMTWQVNHPNTSGKISLNQSASNKTQKVLLTSILWCRWISVGLSAEVLSVHFCGSPSLLERYFRHYLYGLPCCLLSAKRRGCYAVVWCVWSCCGGVVRCVGMFWPGDRKMDSRVKDAGVLIPTVEPHPF